MIWRNDKDGIGLIEGEMAQGAYLETAACPVSSDRSMAGLEGGVKVYRFVLLDRHVA
jgi:hypothetical protein